MHRLADCQTVGAGALLETARDLHDADWRLVTATCVPRRTGRTVLYHFERGEHLRHLRVELPMDGSVPSIGAVFPAAFLVENEMAELQDLSVAGLAIDYGGRLYRDFEGTEGGPADGGRPTLPFEAAGLARLDACVPVVGDREVRPTTTRVPVGPERAGNGTLPHGTDDTPAEGRPRRPQVERGG